MKLINKSHNKKYKTEKVAKFHQFTLRMVDPTMDENFTRYMRKQTRSVAKVFTCVMMLVITVFASLTISSSGYDRNDQDAHDSYLLYL